MKKEKKPKIKKVKLPKEKLSVRAKNNFAASKDSFKEFMSSNRRSLVLFGGLSILVAAVSLVLTAYWVNYQVTLMYGLNIFPRLATLFIFIAPAFLYSHRRTVFSIGASLWMTWILYVYNCRVSWVLLAFTVGILLSGICFKLDTLKPWYSKGRSFMLAASKWFYVSVALVLILEIIHRMNPVSALETFIMNPDTFGNNIIIFTALAAFVLILRRRKLAFFIYSALWVILAYSSYLKCIKLFEPAFLLDIFEMGEAISAMFTYLSFFNVLIIVILLVLLGLGIRFFVKKETKKPFRLANIIIVIVIYLITFGIMAGITTLPYAQTFRTGENKKDAFYRNGFVYSFVTSVAKSSVSMPGDYSLEAVKKIISDTEETYVSRESDEVKKPFNVVAIQLESFVDSYFFKDVTYEYDPLPFIHSLQENYSTGYVRVPVFGGQTVKSEFEFLTGLSMDNLPSGYNPFVQYILNHPTDNIANYFKDNNYTVTCIHDYQGEFFNRNKVYYNLNFDRFVPRECISDIELRGEKIIFGNDEVFTRQMKEVMNASVGGDFIFDITCQLHGSYEPIPKEEYPMEISLAPDEDGVVNEEFEGQIAYFTKEMLRFDEAIKSIIEYLEARGEPTYVIMYADHLPTLANDLVDNDTRYKTQYFTWNNMGIPKDEDREMELYMLSTYLCEQIGIDGTVVNKFHSINGDSEESSKDFSFLQYYKMYEEEAELYPGDSVDKGSSENTSAFIFGGILIVILTVFAIVMIGKKRFVLVVCVVLLVSLIFGATVILLPKEEATHENENAGAKFENTDYIISQITEIKVDKIMLSDEILVCQGEGFTKDTAIAINGKNYPLTYVDDNTAIILGFDAPIQDGDAITLRIVGARNGGTFTETEHYPYYKIEFFIDKLPDNVQEKIKEMEEAAATPTPSPEITATPEITPEPTPTPKVD